MARATSSVQVERVVLVKRLKEILKEIPKDAKEYDDAQKSYKQEVTDWLKELVKDPANFSKTEAYWWRGDDTVIISFTPKALKTKPKYTGPEQPRVMGMYAEREIQNTINVLELSNSEFVGVSILNKVSQYL